MRNTRPLLLAFLGLLGAIGLFQGVQAFRAADVPETAKATTAHTIQLLDSESTTDPCVFWAPWRRLVAPGVPKAYLERLKRRLDEPSARSGDYKKMIERAHGVLDGKAEKVCISGRMGEGGAYVLDAQDTNQCSTLPSGFLESNLQIAVEEGDGGGFINDIEVQVGMDHVRPEGVVEFMRDEVRLMRAGYKGWSKAFPAYFEVNRSGFGLTEYVLDPTGEARLTYLWLNQAMMSVFPEWAQYLFKLSDLVSIQTSFLGAGDQRLFSTRFDTTQSGIDFRLPQAAQNYLDQPGPMPLTVTHDFIIRFRGLIITLKDMRFTGQFTPEPGKMVYDGRFVGIGGVLLSGAYRGISGGSFGQMVYELVQEKIKEELNRLTKGNHGKGWVFRISHETVGSANVFTYKTTLQTPVNFLNLVREEKDQTESPVLPNRVSIQQLNRQTAKSVDALLLDEASHPCAALP